MEGVKQPNIWPVLVGTLVGPFFAGLAVRLHPEWAEWLPQWLLLSTLGWTVVGVAVGYAVEWFRPRQP
jgi:hypothetical protein